MAGVPLLLTLLSLCSGSWAQSALSQQASMSASLGQEVTLVCTGSGGDVGLYDASWHKEIPGDVSKFVTIGYSRPFSNTYYLTMPDLKPEDEASYYCSTWDSSTNAYVFGSGTELTVLGQPKSAPKITVFPPSSEELQTNKATVVCLINDFSPRTITVAWEADDVPITQGVQTTKPSKESTNYMASSYLSLTADQWKSYKSVSCRVTHEGSLVEKSLSPAQCS